MKGGTEEEVKLKLIVTVVHHLWWTFQRHSPHALTGRFIGNGWLNVKDGPSCARASSLILGRDCEIMRQMAAVIEDAISGNLALLNGRRADLVPWQPHQLEWREEVGGVFQAERHLRLARLVLVSDEAFKAALKAERDREWARPDRRGHAGCRDRRQRRKSARLIWIQNNSALPHGRTATAVAG